jgi:hypothetical protein
MCSGANGYCYATDGWGALGIKTNLLSKLFETKRNF